MTYLELLKKYGDSLSSCDAKKLQECIDAGVDVQTAKVWGEGCYGLAQLIACAGCEKNPEEPDTPVDPVACAKILLKSGYDFYSFDPSAHEPLCSVCEVYWENSKNVRDTVQFVIEHGGRCNEHVMRVLSEYSLFSKKEIEKWAKKGQEYLKKNPTPSYLLEMKDGYEERKQKRSKITTSVQESKRCISDLDKQEESLEEQLAGISKRLNQIREEKWKEENKMLQGKNNLSTLGKGSRVRDLRAMELMSKKGWKKKSFKLSCKLRYGKEP